MLTYTVYTQELIMQPKRSAFCLDGAVVPEELAHRNPLRRCPEGDCASSLAPRSRRRRATWIYFSVAGRRCFRIQKPMQRNPLETEILRELDAVTGHEIPPEKEVLRELELPV